MSLPTLEVEVFLLFRGSLFIEVLLSSEELIGLPSLMGIPQSSNKHLPSLLTPTAPISGG